MSGTLVLAGGGKMGGALLGGWLDKGLDANQITVVEPDSDTAGNLKEKHGVAVVEAASGLDPLPPSISQGVRSPFAAHSPRPFQPAFGSSMRPSKPFA